MITSEIRVASIAYFRALRREWMETYPKALPADCPVPDFDSMNTTERLKFAKAMKVALAAAKPENVRRFIANEEIANAKRSPAGSQS